MPIRMRSALLHGNVFHYILLSADAGVKPVCSPHVATTRRFEESTGVSLQEDLLPWSPGVGAASSLWAAGWTILCRKGQSQGSGGSAGPTTAFLISSANAACCLLQSYFSHHFCEDEVLSHRIQGILSRRAARDSYLFRCLGCFLLNNNKMLQ